MTTWDRPTSLDVKTVAVAPPPNYVSALEPLGKLRPEGWLWNGVGYYDENYKGEEKWMSHWNTEMVDFEEIKERIKI